MSRSERKPIWTQGYGGKPRKAMKRISNHKVRKADTASGSAFKKVMSSWDIIDFRIPDNKDNPKPWKVRRK